MLYDSYITPMAGLCQRYLDGREDIEDVLSEGFVKVFKHLNKFEYRGEASLEVWIRKIMINQCLMHIRKKKSFLTIAANNEPIQEEHNRVEAGEIIHFIYQLPQGYRTILNLYIIDGYSHKEIAQLLGITESASRSQLTHARERLKKLLNEHGWNGMIK